jgi:fatty acid desaturase
MATEHDNYPDDTTEEEYYDDNDPNAVEIYSKSAIWGFTIFFSTLFGGVLLALNLRAAGYKRAALSVVLFALSYFALSFIIGSYLAATTQYIGLILNIIGGAILTGYFFNKYFPDDDYYPKSIWPPLAVSILIIIGLTLIIYYTPGMRQQLLIK